MTQRSTSYDDFAKELGIAKPTAENVIRDLVMIGHAEANRRTETVSLEAKNEDEASRLLLSFCLSHVVYQELLKDKGDGSILLDEDMAAVSRRVLRLPSGSETLFSEYSKRLLRWFISVGLITAEDGSLRLQARVPHSGLLDITTSGVRRRRGSIFLGEAPPKKALEALQMAQAGQSERALLERICGRNAITTLVGLGLLLPTGEFCCPKDADFSAEEQLRTRVRTQQTIVFVGGLIGSGERMRTGVIGQHVAKKFGYTWSVASCQRYGSAINVWTRWAFQQFPAD